MTVRKGTSRRHASNAKLTPEMVLDIKRRGGRNPRGDRHNTSGWSQSELAKMHGVSVGLIARVLRRQEWADIEPEDDE